MPRVIRSDLKKGNQLADLCLTIYETVKSNVIYSNFKLCYLSISSSKQATKPANNLLKENPNFKLAYKMNTLNQS